MPTTSLAGDRSRRVRNPRDVTGARFAELQHEKSAREAAADIDIPEALRAAQARGHADGYAKGLDDGWDTCIRALVEEGILDADDAPEDAEDDA